MDAPASLPPAPRCGSWRRCESCVARRWSMELQAKIRHNSYDAFDVQELLRSAETAEARLRTATETLRQIIEWSSDANYSAGMIDIERAARDGLALITRERTP